jgi:3'-phosphoadenosine 5'-phosphosulfate sulfotransferase (PAPS reductase)/FAD synthetase
MSRGPFYITGPAVISFSGGRTSAYMLWRVLEAHDGVLPPDVLVAFANTGKEREETLRFVHECSSRWSVRVAWLERTAGGGFREVGYNSASRQGEPFTELIREKGFAPNRGAGFCSIELKGRVIRDYCRARGFVTGWPSIIGLRHDEGLRVMKALARNDSRKDPWRNVMPLATAKVTRRTVMEFWAAQAFDLGLLDYEGNCDLCWKKSDTKIMRSIRDDPARADWWIAREAETYSAFRTPSIVELAHAVAIQPNFPGLEQVDDGEEHDSECGLSCAAEVA